MTARAPKCKTCTQRSCAVATLSDAELDMLANNIAEATYEAGETLFHENVLNAHVIYLKKGLVKLHTRVNRQKDYILQIITAPSYLGLPTVFGDRLNHFSATALEPTSVCFIDIDTFKHLIHTNGRFAYEIIAILSREELYVFRRYVNQAHKQTPGRLAGALLFFSEEVYHSSCFELPLTRKELGELIGTTRENATRTLMQFKKDGIIDLDRNRIDLLDVDALKRIQHAG